MVQDGVTRAVTITYTILDEPAVVTVDIQTNGVSIGGENLWYFAGDVNKVVAAGARTITWRPDKAWPGNKVDSGVKAVVTAWATNTPPDYMVVSLVAAKGVNWYATAESVPFGVTNDMYKTENLVLRKCPAANVQWRMGSPTTEAGRYTADARETAHLVTLTNDYYIGIYEMTQRQHELLTNLRPSTYTNDAYYATRPVETASYNNIRGALSAGANWPSFGSAVGASSPIQKLRDITGIDTFDLPTVAQWEFACRAGCGSALYNGKELDPTWPYVSSDLALIGRYSQNGGKNGSAAYAADCSPDYATAKVGSYAPNAWGIYDMLGNVREWCRDWFNAEYYLCDPETGPSSGSGRANRGGSCIENADKCRSAYFHGNSDGGNYTDIGYRVMCGAIAK
jgi:formylglycine-generating enzyme required for sulfatase activity